MYKLISVLMVVLILPFLFFGCGNSPEKKYKSKMEDMIKKYEPISNSGNITESDKEAYKKDKKELEEMKASFPKKDIKDLKDMTDEDKKLMEELMPLAMKLVPIEQKMLK